MERPSKDTYFVHMLAGVCARSTCVRRSVGAILVDADGRILATGYNGPPRGFPHCTAEAPCPGAADAHGDFSKCLAVHAEQNCLLFCWRLDLADTLYTTVSPCFTCAKLILQTGIARVIAAKLYPDDAGTKILVEQRKLWLYHESGSTQLLAV